MRTPRPIRILTGLTLVCLVLAFPQTILSKSPGSADDVHWRSNPSFVGPSGLVDALVMSGDDLYASGRFTKAGGKDINHVARWDGNEWHKIGSGVGTEIMGLIHVLLIDGENIYTAGMFDQVGDVLAEPAANVAMWDGKEWNVLDGGTDRAVRAIVKTPNGDIYIGGEFTSAGGVPARGVARWDGEQWHGLGAGINNHVSALAVHGNDVYVGGAFTSAGGRPVNYVARWDGSDWQPLGGGVNDWVTALAVHKQDVLVGGLFKSAGGVEASSVARWDGSNWHPLGRGVGGAGAASARAFYCEGDDVYVGGFFTSAGGRPANYVALWRGDRWHSLGSGTDYAVKSFARKDGVLYVGGEFLFAGGKASNYLAEWTGGPTSPVALDVGLAQNHPNPFTPSTNTTIDFSLPNDANVELTIYDAQGKRVRKLINGPRTRGDNTIAWNGINDAGRSVSTGVYFYRLEVGGAVMTRKMILLK